MFRTAPRRSTPESATAGCRPTTSGSARPREREEARLRRAPTAAAGVIPTPLWFVLFFIGSIIVAYMLFFADPGEGRVTNPC